MTLIPLSQVRRADRRSKRARAQDMRLQATMTLPRTPEGYARWQRHPNLYDLSGYDTSGRQRTSERWARHRHTSAMFEEADHDAYDYAAQMDPTLSGRENRRQQRRAENDFMRF